MKLECKVPDGTSGNWTIETFTVSENDSGFKLWNLRAAIHGDGSMWDVYDCIVGAFTEYVRPQDQYETLTHLFFNRNNFVTVRELAERMVGQIACIKIQDTWDLDMTLLNARFGEELKKQEARHA